MAARLYRPVLWLTICTFAAGLLALLAVFAVEAYYDSIDHVTVVPMSRNTRVRFYARWTGDYWVTVMVRPNPPLDILTADKTKVDSIHVYDRSRDIPVRRIDWQAVSETPDNRLAEVPLESGHTYDFDIACSGLETLPSNYSTQVRVSPSDSLYMERYHHSVDSMIACVAFFCLGVICSIALLITYMFSRPQ